MLSRFLFILTILLFCLAALWSCQKKSLTSAQPAGTVEWAEPAVADSSSVRLLNDSVQVIQPDTVVADSAKYAEPGVGVLQGDSLAVADTAMVEPKTHPLATAGFLIALAGLGFSLYTPLLCLVGIIICAVARDKINRNPTKFKGKRLANWGLIICVIGLLAYLVVGFIVGL